MDGYVTQRAESHQAQLRNCEDNDPGSPPQDDYPICPVPSSRLHDEAGTGRALIPRCSQARRSLHQRKLRRHGAALLLPKFLAERKSFFGQVTNVNFCEAAASRQIESSSPRKLPFSHSAMDCHHDRRATAAKSIRNVGRNMVLTNGSTYIIRRATISARIVSKTTQIQSLQSSVGRTKTEIIGL